MTGLVGAATRLGDDRGNDDASTGARGNHRGQRLGSAEDAPVGTVHTTIDGGAEG